jgi:hypothetical protein
VNPGELVVTTLVWFLFSTRGYGCIGHPAFPTPSLGGNFLHNSGAPRRGKVEWCLYRVIARNDATKQSTLSYCRVALWIASRSLSSGSP